MALSTRGVVAPHHSRCSATAPSGWIAHGTKTMPRSVHMRSAKATEGAHQNEFKTPHAAHLLQNEMQSWVGRRSLLLLLTGGGLAAAPVPAALAKPTSIIDLEFPQQEGPDVKKTSTGRSRMVAEKTLPWPGFLHACAAPRMSHPPRSLPDQTLLLGICFHDCGVWLVLGRGSFPM